MAEKPADQVMFPAAPADRAGRGTEGIVRPVLEKCGVQPDAIVAEGEPPVAKSAQSQLPPQPGMYLSQPLNEVLERAFDEAGRFKDEFVSTEHLLLAHLRPAQRSRPANCSSAPAPRTTPFSKPWCPSAARSASPIRIPKPNTRRWNATPYDLTESARKGKLDPVIGREDEIRRVMQVLSRRTKNNPVLIGEPGVGKTAIVEGLAQRIVRGDVPDQLQEQAAGRASTSAP